MTRKELEKKIREQITATGIENNDMWTPDSTEHHVRKIMSSITEFGESVIGEDEVLRGRKNTPYSVQLEACNDLRAEQRKRLRGEV